MRKQVFITLCCLLAVSVMAANRTALQMREIAGRKLAGYANGENSAARGTRNIALVADRPTLSVFASQAGYVIVSRDDRFPEILAYGTGAFDVEKAPANVRWWYESIQRGLEGSPRDALSGPAASRQAIAPFLTTKWGQGSPYNNYAPVPRASSSKAPAGCVAVSMGQVMNFNEYPPVAQFTGSYIVDGESGQHVVEVNSAYTWPYLTAYSAYVDDSGQVVSASATPRQGNLVAALLRDCGYSVDMFYSAAGSGAVSAYIADALVSCFGYPVEAVKYRSREFCTDEEWEDIIYGELQKGSPVIYNGDDANGGGGHSFVVHGMDENGLLFVNWGWNGLYDGYYEYRLLNPDVEEFSLGQDVIYGIRREALESDRYESMLGGDLYSFAYDNAEKVLTLNNGGFYNWGGLDIVGRVAVVAENLSDPDQSVYIDFIEPGDTLEKFYGYGQFTDKVDVVFPEGIYRLYIASRDYREAEWQPMRMAGGIAICYAMTVDADGTTAIAETPDGFTTGVGAVKDGETPSADASARFYDLRGREVDASAKGLVIVKQGSTVRKVVR